jgi:hypothetical protein
MTATTALRSRDDGHDRFCDLPMTATTALRSRYDGHDRFAAPDDGHDRVAVSR